MARISVKVDDFALDPAKELAEFSGDAIHGACDLFSGAVRVLNHGKQVVSVSYDAFVPLAEKTLHEICTEAAERFGEDLAIRVRHRTGELKVGEVSVAIIVHARHRGEAFNACRYVIEELKTRVPIWKKERYTDGETSWLRGHALCSGH